ncbi:hypothetical protein ACXNSR_16550 [Streptomyces sp. NC-S4]
MAGESPDKSVDEGAPGAAESSAERDPRLSVFRPRDPEGGATAGAGETGGGAAVDIDVQADAESPAGDGGRESLRADAGADADADGESPADADAESPAGGRGRESSRAAAAAGGHADADAESPADGGRDLLRAAADVDVDAESGVDSPAGDSAGREPLRAGADAESGAESPAGAGGRDPLRDAVAAWVASADDADDDAAAGEAEDSVSVDDEESADESDADGSGTPDARTEAPESDSASGVSAAPAEPEPEAGPSKAEKPADGERTAVFRAFEPAKPKPAAAPPKAEEPADSARTAVFRAFKADSASAPAAEPSKPADNERTAVFRAVKPASASAAPAEPKPAAEASKAEEPADNERTTVFRAVKPASAPAAEPKPAAETAKPKEPEQPADSERTAVFRVPKVDAAEPEASKPAPAKPAAGLNLAKPAEAKPASKPTEAKPAEAKPASKPTEAKPAEAKPSETAAEPPKGSTFVPLRPEGIAPASAPPARQRPKLPAPPAAARLDHSERTTQQPLPPKPPLDMLADLTNNPPPPPSPLRTAIRRVKIYAPLVALLVVILAVVQLVRPLPEPKLVMTGKSSYTFDGAKPQLPWPTEGQAYMAAAGLGTLGQSGEQKPVPIASVTKSMTAYIILRDHPIKKGEQGQMIDVDKTAETEGKKNNSTDNESTLDTVKEGDKISEYDAIAALMIPSANNIARLLARWDSGSQEAFVKKMNDTAKELGMTNTTYTDPSGLDATTVSTAEDQVKLGLKLVEIETLLDITKKPNWVDPSGKSWRNWNGLTGPTGALGIKTGTTTKAGGNLLFAAQKKVGNTNQLIVGAVLGQHKPSIIDTVLAASKDLMLATQKALEAAPVVKKGQVVGYVDDGLGGRTPVVATADVQAVGWASLTVDIKLADGGGKLPQTATAGTEVGVLTVGEGASQVKVPVALKSDLASPGIGSKLTRVG